MTTLRTIVINLSGYHRFFREPNAWLAYHFFRKKLREGDKKTAKKAMLEAFRLTKDPEFKQQMDEILQQHSHVAPWRLWWLKRWHWLGPVVKGGMLSAALIFFFSVYRNPALVESTLPKGVTAISETILNEKLAYPFSLYPEFRVGENYVLADQLRMHLKPDVVSPVVDRIPKYTALFVEDSVHNHRWLKVTTSNGSQGYVAERYVGFGEAYKAKQLQCDQYPKKRPENGQVLQATHRGPFELTINNPHHQDALVQLIPIASGSFYQLYVRRGESATFDQLMSGEYQMVQQRGDVYNQHCGFFMKNFAKAKLEGLLKLIAKQKDGRVFYSKVTIKLP